MDPIEPGEDSTPPDPHSKPNRNPEAEAPDKDGQAQQPLTVNVSRAGAPDESLSVNLGETEDPDEPGSHVHITLDLAEETRVRVAVESLPPSTGSLETEAHGGTKVLIEGQGDNSDPVITLQPAARRISLHARIANAKKRWPYLLA